MKLRTDFVTNSSSSNFNILIRATGLSREEVVFELDLNYYVEYGGTIYLRLDTKKLFEDIRNKRKHFENSRQLAELLMTAVESGFEDAVFEEEDQEEFILQDYWEMTEWECRQDIEDNKQRFIEAFSQKMPKLENINRIEIVREKTGWGEGCDLLVDNDYSIRSLVEKAHQTDCNPESLEALRRELDTHKKRSSFGSMGDNMEVRIEWDGKDKSLIDLIERFSNNWGPDSTKGTEFRIMDFKNRKYEEYVVFVLS